MDCCHNAALDRSEVVESLGHRSQAVGRTRSCGENFHIRSEGLVVDVVNDCWEVIAGRSGDDDFLCACFEVSRSFFFAGVETSAFENDIDIMFAPRNFFCVFNSIDDDLFAVNNDGVFFSFDSVFAFADFASIAALCGVIFEKMSKHLWAGEIVDSNDFITFSSEHLTECETTKYLPNT